MKIVIQELVHVDDVHLYIEWSLNSKKQYNEYMNTLEKLNNINYNHSFENGSLSERHTASQYPTWGAGTKSM
jgi:hypothetical protein